MKISLLEATIRFYGVHRFRYSPRAKALPRIDWEKSQYVYRAICITDGSLLAELDGTSHVCRTGDVLFLVPGSRYRLIPQEKGFSLINLFFDLLPPQVKENPLAHRHCVFWEDFEAAHCPAPLEFSDARLLEQSGVFHCAHCAPIFAALCAANPETPLFPLYAKAKLEELVFLLAGSAQSAAEQTADRILRYIQLHPAKQLSAAGLEKHFGYHRNYINALIKQHTGKSLTRYIRKVKIDYAQTLIATTKMPLTQVAEELGYYDYSHFYKAYLAETGAAPSAGSKQMPTEQI